MREFEKFIDAGEKLLNSAKDFIACSEILLNAVKDLDCVLSKDDEGSKVSGRPPAPAKTNEEKKYTKEELRAALSTKSSEGFDKEVRSLLKKYGALKLSEVKEEDYAALICEAKEIGND